MGSLSEAFALSQGKATVDAKGVVQGIGSNVISEGPGKALFAVDIDGFTSILNRIVKETKRSASETVRYGMIEMLRSGRAATPTGKKNRKLVDDGRAKGAHFNVYYQGQQWPHKVWVPSAKKTSGMSTEEQQKQYMIRESMIKRYTPIDRVGLAKASWGWALKKFCGSGSVRLPGRVDHDPITGIKLPYSITVENKLTWINKLVPGIERLMITKASKKMLHNLDNKIKGAFARAAGV